MDARKVYSKGIKAESLSEGEILTLTIDSVRTSKFEGQNDRLELRFGETDKTLILNTTNNDFLVARLGHETDDWPGAKIRLSKRKMDRPYKGATHSLTITAAKVAPVISGGQIYPPPKENNVEFGQDIPFDDQF